MRGFWRRVIVLSVVAAGWVAPGGVFGLRESQAQGAVKAAEIPQAALVQPEALAAELKAGGDKPLVLQVGSRVLFEEAHIAGSEFVGAGGTEAGLEALRTRLKDVPRDRAVVVYCGCCPWGKCPNIRAAYAELLALKFTRVRAMYVAQDFGKDWVARGYPVEKGMGKGKGAR